MITIVDGKILHYPINQIIASWILKISKKKRKNYSLGIEAAKDKTEQIIKN